MFRIFILIVFLSCQASCQGEASKKSNQDVEQEFYCNEGFDILEEYEYDALNMAWLKEDLDFYSELQEICLERPKQIAGIFQSNNSERVDMGNGFYVEKGSVGKGYLNLYYTTVYCKEELIAYELKLSKNDFLLLERFQKNPDILFNEKMNFRSNQNEYLFYFGYNEVCAPFSKSENLNESEKDLQYYTTPFSGIRYGCRGGYTNGILKNRCIFKKIIHKRFLLEEELIYILKSVNLASRLTAIEYYTRNISSYDSNTRERIDGIIKEIFLDSKKLKMSFLMEDIAVPLTIEEIINLNLESPCF